MPHGSSCQLEQGWTAVGRGAASAAAPCLCRVPRGVCAALLGRLSDWAYHLAVTPLLPYTQHSRSTNPLVASIALILLCLGAKLVHDPLAQAIRAFAFCAALTSRAQAWTRHFRRVLEWRPVHDLVACARAERKQSLQAGIIQDHTLVGPMWHQ